MASPSASGPAVPAPQRGNTGKGKAEALEACAEQHFALVRCFKTCSFASSFTGCCTDEHKAFWECYTRERGTNQTRINSWLDGIFGGGGDSNSSSSTAQRQGQKQQQEQQQKEH